MPEATAIRVILVDDHPVVRFGLAAIIGLQPDMTVVGEAGSGEEACAVCMRQVADVMLMDLRLPGMSGVEAIRAIRKPQPKLRFIVLTTYDGDEDIHRALEAGAQAYLLKGMSHNDLVNAIRKVHAGLKFIPASVSKSLAERPPHSELSAREMEVLELIVKGLSNREIGEALGISEATVKWHINIILSRLNVSDRTQATVAALQRGIVHLP
ncbi:MAG TPA: response regulator transcription factor [Bryobacteraceae bacterium]|jgi:DNA-binding NarL/FixJ family response regulator|nr:response regulator transcription factor [Bryobacteraceae bacterium]